MLRWTSTLTSIAPRSAAWPPNLSNATSRLPLPSIVFVRWSSIRGWSGFVVRSTTFAEPASSWSAEIRSAVVWISPASIRSNSDVPSSKVNSAASPSVMSPPPGAPPSASGPAPPPLTGSATGFFFFVVSGAAPFTTRGSVEPRIASWLVGTETASATCLTPSAFFWAVEAAVRLFVLPGRSTTLR